MRILLYSPNTMAFNVVTPEHQPLGGIASCQSYLARALAARGHEVTFVAVLPEGTPPLLEGVLHVPQSAVLADAQGFFRAGDYDVVLAANYPDLAPHVKLGSPRTFNLAWMHVYPDQPAAAPLATHQRWLDGVVCVSESLRRSYRLAVQTAAVGNGISPFFQDMFSSPEELLAAKQNRAVYASMPFRGLDVAALAMGQVRGKVELDVYSSMRAYQAPEGDFTLLYDFIRRNPRIRYHGGVGQKALAEGFRRAAYFAYPSTFIESYCIVAQEAIAAGLKVISNDLGALPETTMGFADLFPVRGVVQPAEQVAPFVKLLEKNEIKFTRNPRAWAQQRFEQMQVINQRCTWAHRAAEWEALLMSAMAPGVRAT